MLVLLKPTVMHARPVPTLTHLQIRLVTSCRVRGITTLSRCSNSTARSSLKPNSSCTAFRIQLFRGRLSSTQLWLGCSRLTTRSRPLLSRAALSLTWVWVRPRSTASQGQGVGRMETPDKLTRPSTDRSRLVNAGVVSFA